LRHSSSACPSRTSSIWLLLGRRGAAWSWCAKSRPRPSRMVQDPDAGADEPHGVGARDRLRRRRPGAYPLRRLGVNGAGKGGRELGRSGSTAGGARRRHGGDGRVARIGVRSAPRPPSVRQPRTRADYWRAWRLVVSWGVACKALGAVLPMSLTTLRALTWDLVCFAVPTSQVELVWKAVQARHRRFHLPPPMCEANH
jgi:hypothetical protein